MRKQNGTFGERAILLFVMVLAIPLVGLNVLPDPALINALWGKQDHRPVSVQSNLTQSVVAAGNVERGRDLFMGNTHFKNDGPPCMGCHNVGNNGLLGGGAMGPDLTNVSTRRSQTEIASILSNSGSAISPVMQPIYTEHPLTESEQADLIAFLNASVGQPESNKEIIVIGISIAGFVLAVLVLGFVYRGRLRSVRRALVNQAQKELQ